MHGIPPPQVGFNNNVKHRGRVFHIQTEDSGVKRPHITTHLFVDGGVVVKSKRTDYSKDIDAPDLVKILRKRMKDQHKGMFIALREGRLDSLIDGLLGIKPPASAPEPPSAAGSRAASAAPAEAPAARKSLPRKSRSKAPGRRRSLPPSAQPRPRSPVLSGASDVVAAAGGGISTFQDELTPVVPLSAQARSSRGAKASPRPPTKASVPAAAPSGAPANTVTSESSLAPSPSSASGKHSSNRYAASRPSAGFGSADSSSIFGGSQISEQSLDDVILSYISEDLKGPAKTGE